MSMPAPAPDPPPTPDDGNKQRMSRTVKLVLMGGAAAALLYSCTPAVGGLTALPFIMGMGNPFYRPPVTAPCPPGTPVGACTPQGIQSTSTGSTGSTGSSVHGFTGSTGSSVGTTTGSTGSSTATPPTSTRGGFGSTAGVQGTGGSS